MAQTRKMMRLEEPRTSETGGSGGNPMVQKTESQPRKEKKSGETVKKGRSAMTKGKKRRWDPAVMAAELAKENHRAK